MSTAPGSGFRHSRLAQALIDAVAELAREDSPGLDNRNKGARVVGAALLEYRGFMDKLSLQNPLFATYVIAATLMILKVVAMSWLTVVRMMQVNGGFRSPEDLRKTALNPSPDPKQLDRNEAVDRVRRIQLNDLENVPFFLVAGFLYILTEPSLIATRLLLYGYVASRLAHFAAYFTAQTHDMRATLWTIGSLILVYLAGWPLLVALGV
jgi:glutathione S-transferase